MLNFLTELLGGGFLESLKNQGRYLLHALRLLLTRDQNFATILVIAFNIESPLFQKVLHSRVFKFLPNHSFRVIYPSLLFNGAFTNNKLAYLVYADPRRGGFLTQVVFEDLDHVVIEVPDSHA